MNGKEGIESLIQYFWTYHQELGVRSSILSEIYRPDLRLESLLLGTKESLIQVRGTDITPKISVIIPAYNEQPNISAVLTSLALNTETAPSTEVIVIDNSSTDLTGKISSDAGALVVSCKDKGIGAARQTGLLVAQGELIVCTDADTVVPRNWLHKIATFFENNQRAEAIYGGVVLLDEMGPNQSLGWYCIARKIVHLGRAFLGKPMVSCANFSLRREALLEVGGFNPKLKRGVDAVVAREFIKRGTLVRVADPEMVVVTSGRRMLTRGLLSLGKERIGEHIRSMVTQKSNGIPSQYEDFRLAVR